MNKDIVSTSAAIRDRIKTSDTRPIIILLLPIVQYRQNMIRIPTTARRIHAFK